MFFAGKMVGFGSVTILIHFGSRYQKKQKTKISLTGHKLQKIEKTLVSICRVWLLILKKQTKFCISTSTAATSAHLLLVQNVIFKGVKRG